MSGALPRSWSRIELGELAAFVSGGTPDRSTDRFWQGDIPWVSAKDLKRFRIWESEDRLTPEGLAEVRTIPKGAILILVRGMGLFKDFPVGIAQRDLAINQDLKALIAVEGIDPVFLGYALLAKKHAVMSRVDRAGHGTGRLSTDYLLALPIEVPPLAEQRRIADALGVWDRAIETAEALVAAKQARASALAVRLTWNHDDPWVSLDHLLIQSTQRVGPNLSPPIFSVSKEGLSPQEDRFNKRIANEDLSRHMLVLPGQLALSGLNFWLGSVAVSEEPGPICISPDYKVFTLSGLVDSRFFKHVVRSKPFRDLLIACSTERASIVRRNFNRDLFFASEIPLPAPELQVKRAAQLEALLQDVRLAEQRLKSLRTQKLGLMQKLLAGEWRVRAGASEQAA